MAESAGQIEGLEAVIGKLKTLEQLPRQKTTRFALRKAANLVRDAARANAARVDDPSTSANIAANIAVGFDSRHHKATGDLKMRVGVKGGASGNAASLGELRGKGKGNPGGETFHWRWIEFGRGPVSVNKGVLANRATGEFFGTSVKGVPAKPFLRPAMEQNTGAATTEFIKHFEKAIARAVKKANKAKATR